MGRRKIEPVYKKIPMLIHGMNDKQVEEFVLKTFKIEDVASFYAAYGEAGLHYDSGEKYQPVKSNDTQSKKDIQALKTATHSILYLLNEDRLFQALCKYYGDNIQEASTFVEAVEEKLQHFLALLNKAKIDPKKGAPKKTDNLTYATKVMETYWQQSLGRKASSYFHGETSNPENEYSAFMHCMVRLWEGKDSYKHVLPSLRRVTTQKDKK